MIEKLLKTIENVRDEEGVNILELLAILAVLLLIIGGTIQAYEPQFISWFVAKVMTFFP